MTRLEERVAALKAELAREEAKLAEQNSMTKEQKLATKLHDLICLHGHDTGCNWHEEAWDTPRGSKLHYLKIAKELLALERVEEGMPWGALLDKILNIMFE